MRFVFGRVPTGVDLGDADARARLLGVGRADLQFLVATQILDDAPAAVWSTALRLVRSGTAPDDAMDQLVLALAAFVHVYEGEFDAAGYAAALDRLPLPDAGYAVEAYLDVARERVAIGVDDLWELVAARLRLDPDDPLTEQLLSDVDLELMEDPGSPLTMLSPDVVVHAPALTAGAVLTHRLSAAEHAEGWLDLDTDLAGFLRVAEPRVPQGLLYVDDAGAGGPVSWSGPVDWLAGLPLDALLAVRAGEDGEVRVEVLAAEPVAPPGLVGALREVYDQELEEPGLPVSAEDLVLGMLYRDRSAFAQPRPPLTELAAAAGLERRGHEFAHSASVWAQGAEADRLFRLMHRLGPGERCSAAVAALDLLAGSAGPAALRRALDLLEDPDVLVAAVEEWLGIDDDPDRVLALVEVADRLVTAAGRSPRAAVARWIAAVAAERDGRVLDAESHLRAAVQEAPGWAFVEDRLAWYESDRGDAVAALGRWSAIGDPGAIPELETLAPLAAAVAPEPGRNERCWCGSGRKFKQCHQGMTAPVPLPQRVGWLCRKAAGYLDRRGGAAEHDLFAFAELYSADPDEALADPLVRDVVLHEGGWFERFLAERGPLLPADEGMLAASWTLVERTVYEVVEVAAGTGVTVRDLRTGDRTEVTERTFSRAATVGQLVCARAVPDGAGQQFVGGLFAVPPGRERNLLDVLDRGDGEELLSWVARGGAPGPAFATRVEPVGPGPAGVADALDRFERRWCDEAVPALDGLTPRAAVADPTRRDDVVRLIASFPEIDPASGAFGLRPWRLRELLDLQ